MGCYVPDNKDPEWLPNHVTAFRNTPLKYVTFTVDGVSRSNDLFERTSPHQRERCPRHSLSETKDAPPRFRCFSDDVGLFENDEDLCTTRTNSYTLIHERGNSSGIFVPPNNNSPFFLFPQSAEDTGTFDVAAGPLVIENPPRIVSCTPLADSVHHVCPDQFILHKVYSFLLSNCRRFWKVRVLPVTDKVFNCAGPVAVIGRAECFEGLRDVDQSTCQTAGFDVFSAFDGLISGDHGSCVASHYYCFEDPRMGQEDDDCPVFTHPPPTQMTVTMDTVPVQPPVGCEVEKWKGAQLTRENVTDAHSAALKTLSAHVLHLPPTRCPCVVPPQTCPSRAGDVALITLNMTGSKDYKIGCSFLGHQGTISSKYRLIQEWVCKNRTRKEMTWLYKMTPSPVPTVIGSLASSTTPSKTHSVQYLFNCSVPFAPCDLVDRNKVKLVARYRNWVGLTAPKGIRGASPKVVSELLTDTPQHSQDVALMATAYQELRCIVVREKGKEGAGDDDGDDDDNDDEEDDDITYLETLSTSPMLRVLKDVEEHWCDRTKAYHTHLYKENMTHVACVVTHVDTYTGCPPVKDIVVRQDHIRHQCTSIGCKIMTGGHETILYAPLSVNAKTLQCTGMVGNPRGGQTLVLPSLDVDVNSVSEKGSDPVCSFSHIDPELVQYTSPRGDCYLSCRFPASSKVRTCSNFQDLSAQLTLSVADVTNVSTRAVHYVNGGVMLMRRGGEENVDVSFPSSDGQSERGLLDEYGFDPPNYNFLGIKISAAYFDKITDDGKVGKIIKAGCVFIALGSKTTGKAQEIFLSRPLSMAYQRGEDAQQQKQMKVNALSEDKVLVVPHSDTLAKYTATTTGDEDSYKADLNIAIWISLGACIFIVVCTVLLTVIISPREWLSD